MWPLGMAKRMQRVNTPSDSDIAIKTQCVGEKVWVQINTKHSDEKERFDVY